MPSHPYEAEHDAAVEREEKIFAEHAAITRALNRVPGNSLPEKVRLLLRVSDRCEYLGPPECGGAFAKKRRGVWSVYRGQHFDVVRCGDVFEAERVRGGQG